jgi:glycosyltransferase involved in cell wall biosynthesis
MKIHYSIVDKYPTYRVDLTELFDVQLRALGLETQWYMDAGQKAPPADPAGNTVITPPVSASSLLGRLRYWLHDIRHMIGRTGHDIDAIQCRDKYIAAVVGLLVARIRRKPYFYWCSYPFPEHYQELASSASGPRKAYYLVHALIGRVCLYGLVLPRADHVFVQSQRMLDNFVAAGISASQMTAVPMGVPPRMLDWVRRTQDAPQLGKVVYLGTLTAVRRLDTILRAFKQVVAAHPHARLWMVGDGDSPHERQGLERLARELGIQDSVVFTGFIPMEQAWQHAREAQVCLSPFFPTPILEVASPTKLVEYMALGRPVVCNDHPEQSLVIKESGGGLSVPWGETEFAAAINRLLDDPSACDAMGAAGAAWVAQARQYDAIARMVMARYRQFMEPARP